MKQLTKYMSKRRISLFIVLISVLFLSGCRNETQNQLRRSLQDFTGQRMFITIYSQDGNPIFEGIVEGSVTRSSANNVGTNDAAAGSYVFWFDERGRYHQTSMPYLITAYDRRDPTLR